MTQDLFLATFLGCLFAAAATTLALAMWMRSKMAEFRNEIGKQAYFPSAPDVPAMVEFDEIMISDDAIVMRCRGEPTACGRMIASNIEQRTEIAHDMLCAIYRHDSDLLSDKGREVVGIVIDRRLARTMPKV